MRLRNFFGVVRVTEQHDRRLLYHGTTLHGSQLLRDSHGVGLGVDERETATEYYAPGSPIGQLMAAFSPVGMKAPIAVIGLGAGTLAAYIGRDQVIDFYEIDRDVVRIADTQFTYLARARSREARVNVVVADGRLGIANAPRQYAVIIVDAFSSDAIPTHLLTEEAIGEYVRALTPDGAVLFHTSNRYIDFEPVLAAAGRRLGLLAVAATIGGSARAERGAATSIVLSRALAVNSPGSGLCKLILCETQGARTTSDTPSRSTEQWRVALEHAEINSWTDDFINLLTVFRRSW